jgi:endoribonuclease Dicer
VKNIADCVEAFIGAFYLTKGLNVAIDFIRAIGIDVDFERDSKIDQSSSNFLLQRFEERLGYNFKHQILLEEALTHTLVTGAKTGSYQRLEFLGDAVLDFLVTRYLYPF